MIIEVQKKSVERFWQTVDFGSTLSDDVRIATCVVTGAVDVIDHDISIVEKGRAVRFMVEKGDGGEFTLVCTLSDGQVIAQDVVVRVDDAVSVVKYDPDQPRDEGGRFGDGGGVGGAGGEGQAYEPRSGQATSIRSLGASIGGATPRIDQMISNAEEGFKVPAAGLKAYSAMFSEMSIEASAGGHKDQADALLRASESAKEAVKEIKGKSAESMKRAAPHLKAMKEHLTNGGIFSVSEMVDRLGSREFRERQKTSKHSIAKSTARAYTGHYAQPTNAAHQDAFAVRAYGSGPDDKRVWLARAAGLPVATCPECDAGAQGERREVAVKDLALSRNALRRGKLSRMASALRDGVREGDDFAAIKVAELHTGDGDGPRYAVIPGEGNHRVAHLMLARKAGTVPVMVVPRRGVAKYDPDQPRDESGRFGEGGGALPGQDAEGFATYAGPALVGSGQGRLSQIKPGTGQGATFGGKPLPPAPKAPSASKTPSADEQRAAFRQKIGDAARADFGTDKPSRAQVQDRSQDQKAKYGKDASVWVWDPSSGSAMPGAIARDAKSDAYERSGQREDRQYVVNVPDIDRGGTRPVTAYHGDIASRVVKKQLSTETPGKGAEFVPVDMAGRRARVRERVRTRRKGIAKYGTSEGSITGHATQGHGAGAAIAGAKDALKNARTLLRIGSKDKKASVGPGDKVVKGIESVLDETSGPEADKLREHLEDYKSAETRGEQLKAVEKMSKDINSMSIVEPQPGERATTGERATIDHVKVAETISKFESDEQWNANTETGHIVASDGTAIATFSDGKGAAVRIPENMLQRLKDATFSHNHPDGTGLSPADIALAARHDLAEMRAFGTKENGERWSYSLKRPEDGWPNADKLKAAIAQKADSVFSEIGERVRTGEITLDQGAEEYERRSLDDVMKRFGMTYKRERK